MRTANERELQKMSQALATLSKIVHILAIREGNKGDGGNNKGGGGGNNSDRGGGGGNHKTSGLKKKNANGGNKNCITTKDMEYYPTWPYKKVQWFKKERN